MELLRQVKSLRKQKVLLHRRACVLGVDGMQAICIPNVGGTVGKLDFDGYSRRYFLGIEASKPTKYSPAINTFRAKNTNDRT